MNITSLKDCYGCGVCVAACPTKVISLTENANGFYTPAIHNPEGCIDCGLCLKVCAYAHKDEVPEPERVDSYAAWSLAPNVRQWCSSGGVGFEIGRLLIEQGHQALGVRYNVTSRRAEHFVAATVEEFMPSVGSKYIPSYSADALLKIDRSKRYLVTGTPCQIASFRRLIRHWRCEDNFVLLDFLCHGTPSLLLWDKYLDGVERITGPMEFVSWRNKADGGWHDSWSMQADPVSDPLQLVEWQDSYNLNIRGKKHFYASRLSRGDIFYRFFLGNFCLNECCYGCTLKMEHSAADLRIGDLWGSAFAENTEGVSALLALTPRGAEVVAALAPTCHIEALPAPVVLEGQMPRPASRPWIHSTVMRALRSPKPLSQIAPLLKVYGVSILPRRVANKLRRLLPPLNHCALMSHQDSESRCRR